MDRELAEGAANEHAGNAFLRGEGTLGRGEARAGCAGLGGGGGAPGGGRLARAERRSALRASAPAARLAIRAGGAEGGAQAIARPDVPGVGRAPGGTRAGQAGPKRKGSERGGKPADVVLPRRRRRRRLVTPRARGNAGGGEGGRGGRRGVVARARAGDAQALVGARRGPPAQRHRARRARGARQRARLPAVAARDGGADARRRGALQAQPPMLVESALDVLCVLLRPAPCGGEEARACHAACFGAVARLRQEPRTTCARAAERRRVPPRVSARGGRGVAAVGRGRRR